MKKLLPDPSAVSAALISFLLLTGCSTFSTGVSETDRLKNSKTSLEITLDAGYDLNPNDRGEASPLKIRLYELQAADLFSQADFLDLYDQDSAALQDSLIKVHRIPAQRPGQKTQLSFPLDPSTRYIAALAEFAHYHNADARVIAPVVPEVRNIGYLSMEGNSLFLKVSPERTALDRARQLFDFFPKTLSQNPFPKKPKKRAEKSGATE